MAPVVRIAVHEWQQPCGPEMREQALRALEDGKLLFFPALPFRVEGLEAHCLAPTLAGARKNVSFDPSTSRLRAAVAEAGHADVSAALQAMMLRFATLSQRLLQQLVPRYAPHLAAGRGSFRPVEIEFRTVSRRKDDTRLHVDSFPSTPVQGRRILRVFSNVNPEGKGRLWRTGEPFEQTAARFFSRLSRPLPGSSQLLLWSGLTKSRRSAYDHFMLQLHDRMKADEDYQREPHPLFDFPAGSTWIAFTDALPHAALRGQYALEQTFYLPPSAMLDPWRSPLRILERLAGRPLA